MSSQDTVAFVKGAATPGSLSAKAHLLELLHSGATTAGGLGSLSWWSVCSLGHVPSLCWRLVGRGVLSRVLPQPQLLLSLMRGTLESNPGVIWTHACNAPQWAPFLLSLNGPPMPILPAPQEEAIDVRTTRRRMVWDVPSALLSLTHAWAIILPSPAQLLSQTLVLAWQPLPATSGHFQIKIGSGFPPA